MRLDTRHRWRVTAQICRLAKAFVIAFARIQSRDAGAVRARLAVDSVDYDDRTLEQERVDTRGLRRLLTS